MLRSAIALLAPLLLAAPAAAADRESGECALWERFRAQAATGSPTDLPDFSWAGYARGERAPAARGRVFNVTAFGARPDDPHDDRAGIAAAVAAAERAGGGVVFLPRGRYLVNTRMQDRGMIPITASGITVRGEGCGAGGTIIHSIHPFDRGDDPRNPSRLHLGDTVFTVYSPAAKRGMETFETLARVAAPVERGDHALDVDDAARIAAGDWVVLLAPGRELLTEMIKPFAVEDAWTSITQDKAKVAEIHQIASVRGRRLILAEPVRYRVDPRHGWTVRRHQPISEIGFEDICFLGNAHQRYSHHRSDLDDSGWSFIKMLGVANGWVQRCAFINSSQAVSVNLSAYVSLLNLVIAGNQGHHGLRSVWYNYGVLGGLCEDRADSTHGPSVSMGSIGTVYWRCSLTPDQPLDFHAGRPYCTLFDACRGGVLYGSTGGLRDFPQHLRDLVIWNLEHRAGGTDAVPIAYDFWRLGKLDRFVLPTIAGFHGAAATFNQEHLAALESPGHPVDPPSLYEAQLALRLGGEPEWIGAAKRERERMRIQALPPHFTLADPSQGRFPVVEEFAAAELLRFLANRSLEINNSRPFTWSAPADLRLRADQGPLRDALYALMHLIYRQGKEGNRIEATAETGATVFRLASGPLRRPADAAALDRDQGLADARVFASQIAATVALRCEGDVLRIELRVPTAP